MRTQIRRRSRIALIKFACLIELGRLGSSRAIRIHKSWTIHLDDRDVVPRVATLDFFDRDLVRCPQVDEEKAALSGICSLALDREPPYAIHAPSYIRTHRTHARGGTRSRTRSHPGRSTRTRYERVGTRCVGH